MNRGRLEQVGTPEEIYEHPQSRFVAEFIGLSNFLEGHVQTVEGDAMVVGVGGLQLTMPALPNAGPGQRVLLFLRPNEVELLRSGDPGGANVFDAHVEKATYLGDTMDYRLTFGQGLALRVQTDAQRRVGQGTQVRLRLPRIRCWAISTG
jgi:ABC-type Fe3+/spermidine/putrescine transport system ATPase subunit